MKVSDYIVKFFEEKEIDIVFGYLGGMITHLADSFSKSRKIQFIQVYHEQTASIAVEGYAREKGIPSVAIATSGPGATNMVTGIADAYFDSIPTIYITGQVNVYESKKDLPIRQLGFQEMDVISMVKDITKYSTMIINENKIRYELEKAYYLAISGRRGPVLLDIPMNIQRMEVDVESLEKFIPEPLIKNDYKFEGIYEMIKKSKRPLLLLGGGCLENNSKNLVNEFLEKYNIPVVTSLMGKGIVDENQDNCLGIIGSYGNRCANMSVGSSDLLIALGTRLDTRQTGAMVEAFLKNGKIIHVDIDNNELVCHRIKDKVNINKNVSEFLLELNKLGKNKLEFSEWNKFVKELKFNFNQEKEVENIENKAPYKLIETLNTYSKEGDVFTADIGQNQMWAAQSLKLKKGQKFFTSGGLAPMGYSIPCAIGVAFAKETESSIYSICGDGGFHMSTQSLMLISQYNLPIKVVVMNNNALGLITQFQELYFDSNMVGTTAKGGYFVPNIKSLAEAYNLEYFEIKEQDLLNKELMLNIVNTKNCIVNYIIEGNTKVYPKLEYNSPIENPSPKLSEIQINKYIIKN